MDTLALECWVYGDDSYTTFSVKISRTETVQALKGIIKDSNSVSFKSVDAVDLNLYSIPIPDDEHFKTTLKQWTLKGQTPLGDQHTLSVLSDNTLIIVGLLSFECWIRGMKPEDAFSVQTSVNARVNDLKNVIKAACSLSPHLMELYKISVNEEAELRECLGALGWGRPLQGNELLERVFDDVPSFQRLRVVVQLGTDHPSSTGSATSNKREHSEDRFEVIKRIRRDFAARPIQNPSSIAMPSHFQEHYQEKDIPHIRCGQLDGDQNPVPLVLAHRIFATFVSECETYEPSDEDLGFILKLSYSMCQFFEDEKDRKTRFRACMREYGINLTEAKIEGTEYTTDGDARVGALPYLISGATDFGASKGDSYIKTAVYHLAATQSWLRAHPDDLCPLPCLHIFYDGPILGFAGSMLTDEFDVNVLGPMLPLFYHRTDIDLQIRCAKMFGALKNAATALKEYYEHTMPQSHADTRFPWITQYNTIATPTETREYKYLCGIDSGNLLFICQHIHDQKRILVKFVRTYSKEAHLVCAARDGAPALLGCDVLPCGWSVVVMEFLEKPDWVSSLMIFSKAELRMVCDKVKEHVFALHQAGFVHGDIRPQNVLVKRSDGHVSSVHLIDFDWAGETNKATYPFLVNPNLGCGFRRPSGVKAGGIMTTEHDLVMVDLMYRGFAPPGVL